MNRSGHVATAMLCGSLALHFMPGVPMKDAVALLVGASIGGLLPDLDHKTSTLSNKVQFSASVRKRFKATSGLFGLLGVIMYLGNLESHLWALLAALACAAAANTRMLILSGSGALLVSWYILQPVHWIVLLLGFALLIMPFVKHRGIIHSPEFALALSAGGLTLVLPDPTHLLVVGLLAGWWAHLAGDALTAEGISSALFPRLKVALHLIHNGGAAEKCIAAASWLLSVCLWANMYL
ncbi:metal-dependent hydrolase [Paenibacillus graminis]|uniref:metal-dependent hydrolase n=1 Tax=Paenibacillus graminis TaxID=189425 RepID=UPI002DBAE204|nr:metal-dependent hydrolase [Paenibacillus graminis]MEC0167386.1 metal-dependent hydrolase [Paenibacillus graminis]